MEAIYELVAVTDQHDQVIGQATIQECHERGLWHRSAFVLIFSSAGMMTLQRRSSVKKPRPMSITATASGHVRLNESYHEAAVRELEEEVGVRTSLIEILKCKGPHLQDLEHVVLFAGVYDGEYSTNKEEVQEIISVAPSADGKYSSNLPTNSGATLAQLVKTLDDYIDLRSVLRKIN